MSEAGGTDYCFRSPFFLGKGPFFRFFFFFLFLRRWPLIPVVCATSLETINGVCTNRGDNCAEHSRNKFQDPKSVNQISYSSMVSVRTIPTD